MLTSNDACKLDLISEFGERERRSRSVPLRTVLVYLRATPKTCLERIRARNRPEETSIDMSYLTTLHHRHEEWLINQSHTPRSSTPVLVVDANQNKERVYTDTNAHVINLISC